MPETISAITFTVFTGIIIIFQGCLAAGVPWGEASKPYRQAVRLSGSWNNKTDLDKILKGKGCNTLFLCGLSAVGCVLATKTGAQNHDYKAFIVKDAIMSHNSDYTKNAEVMFDAISYDAVELILDNC